MAYIKITTSNKLSPAVNYATERSPKNDDKYIQGKRVLGLDSINGSADPNEFNKEQRMQFKQQQTPNYFKHSIRTVLSFSKNELNYRKLSDRYKALKIGKDYTKRAYPNNASLIVEQADGKNHMLHLHIITNARTLTTGKSANHKAIPKFQLPLVHQAMMDNNITPKDNISTQLNHTAKIIHKNNNIRAIRGIKERGGKSWVQNIAQTVQRAKRSAKNDQSFTNSLNKHNIYISYSFRLHRQHGTHKKSLHFYKNKGKNGIKITNKNINDLKKMLPNDLSKSLSSHIGKCIRYRKNGLLYSDGKHTISSSKLGAPYSLKSITKAIQQNKQKNINIPFSLKGATPNMKKIVKNVVNQSNQKHHKINLTKTNSATRHKVLKSIRIKPTQNNTHHIHIKNNHKFNLHKNNQSKQEQQNQDNDRYTELVKDFEDEGYSKKVSQIKAYIKINHGPQIQ